MRSRRSRTGEVVSTPSTATRPGVLILVQNLPVPFDRRVWQEARAVERAGYDVHVVCPRTPQCPAAYEELEGIRIHRYRPGMEARGLTGYLVEYGVALSAMTVLTWRLLRRHRIDVIHVCNPPDLLFLVTLPVSLLRGTRVVFDHHDVTPELLMAKGQAQDSRLVRVAKAFERLTYAGASVSLATNESYRRVAIERGRMAPDDVFVVRSGPDDHFRPVAPDPELKRGRRHLVAYVGVMGIQEGLDHLLDAAREIVHVRGRDDVAFALAGGGPEAARLRARADAMGLAGHVDFLGRIPDDELVRLLCTADVCVNPDEVNPLNDVSSMNKIVEYMALGRPIVQFDLREGRWTAGDASHYAAANDPVSFADEICRLLDDDQLREKMGTLGRERYEHELSWSRQVPVLLAAYERALAAPPRALLRRSARVVPSPVRVALVGPPLEASGGIGRVMSYALAALDGDGGTDVAVRSLDSRGRSANPVWSLGPALRTCAQLGVAALRRRVDVAHVNISAHGSALRKGLVVRACALVRLPVVLHLHASSFPEFFDPLPAPAKRWVRRTFALPGTVVVLSETWRDYARDTLAVGPDALTVLPNAAPGATDAAPRRRAPDEDLRIVFLGRLGERKGVPELLTALADPTLRGRAWRATLAGDGDVAGYRAKVAASGLAERVDLPGWVDADTATALLAQAHVLVLPSRAEGLPMSVLEAFAAAVPVVSTHVGGLAEVVTDGTDGLVVAPGDAGGLSRALSRLLDDEALRVRLAAAAHDRWRERYSVDHYAEQLTRLWAAAAAGTVGDQDVPSGTPPPVQGRAVEAPPCAGS